MMPPELPEEISRSDVRRSPAEARLAEDLRALRRDLDRQTRLLERSEARFRDVIERNADALVVVDNDGTICFANHMASRLFGKPREALVGSAFGFPVISGEITEVDLLAGGVQLVAEMRAVRSEWEGHTAYIASLRDVTERKRAEQDARRLIREQAARVAAEESAHRMRFLLESSTILSASLEYSATLSSLARLCVPRIADWAIVYGLTRDGNPCHLDVAHHDPSKQWLAVELMGLPIESNGAHPVREVIETRRSRVVADVTEAMLAELAAGKRELELTRRLGVSSYMLVPMVARGRSLGAIAFVSATPDRRYGANDLAMAEDVAMRAALAVDNATLYEEAQRANQTKADFLAIVSHDLRTPLTAIIGYSDLLEMGVPDTLSDSSMERVQRIRTSAKHLLYLLNELLSFARLDSGAETAHLQEIDARDVVRDVAQVIDPLAQGRGLEFRLAVPEAPVTMTTDPDKLRQILLNLAGNAVKYTRTGDVSVVLRQPDDTSIEVEVADTGDGIAQQHLEHIFEPFWQVDSTQRVHGGGTGLGLSVVKRLTDLLGGAVTVRSEPGTGSTFTVRLAAQGAKSQ